MYDIDWKELRKQAEFLLSLGYTTQECIDILAGKREITQEEIQARQHSLNEYIKEAQEHQDYLNDEVYPYC